MKPLMSFVNVVLIYFQTDYTIKSTLDLDLNNTQSVSMPLEKSQVPFLLSTKYILIITIKAIFFLTPPRTIRLQYTSRLKGK